MLVQLPIGDWSGDGHGNCSWESFEVEIEGVTDAAEATRLIAEAINKPVGDTGFLHPHYICSEYQQSHITFESKEDAEAFLDLMRTIMPDNYVYKDIHIKGNEFWFDTTEMAHYTMEYARVSIPSLTFKHVGIPWIHSNHFIGYGLLGP